mgnify:CR=1 FL=1
MSVPLIQADMRHLPFRKASLDGLWVCASLLHVPKAEVAGLLGELARAVYIQNDRRAQIKRRINLESGSELIEEKSYTDYRR